MIAFTDWIEGPTGLSDAESEHVLQVMTFPSLMTIDGYRDLFKRQGCEVSVAEDTGRFGRLFELYTEIVKEQLAFDAYEMLAFNTELLDFLLSNWLGSAGSPPTENSVSYASSPNDRHEPRLSKLRLGGTACSDAFWIGG